MKLKVTYDGCQNSEGLRIRRAEDVDDALGVNSTFEINIPLTGHEWAVMVNALDRGIRPVFVATEFQAEKGR